MPFIAWSYFYPFGVLTSPFAHASLGHVTGNLLGTLTLAPIAEYAISHYPTRRGSQSFSSLRTNPFVRVFAIPVGSLVGGLLTGVFSFGPVIGFSGVVFAFAGFALVRYPLVTLLALVGRRVVGLVYQSLRNPEIVASGRTEFVTPWFANIAIHGHYYGFLLGAIAGLLVVRARTHRPSSGRLWFGFVGFAVFQALWALYLPLGGDRYRLYRAVGVGVVFGLATLLTVAALSSRRPLVRRIDLKRHEAAVGLVVVVLLAMSVVAVPVNLIAVADQSNASQGVEIRDYHVFYGEEIPNGYVAGVDVPLYNESQEFNASGVIVTSERRSLWYPAVRKGQLARTGNRTVRIGGADWERTVEVNRTGWQVLGNGTAYKIFFRTDTEPKRLVYTSDRVRADPRVDGRNISIRPTNGSYELVVTNGNTTLETAPIPEPNNETTVAGLRFNRSGTKLTVFSDDTRIQIASRETH
ncbi:rhomboid family intramembrane serine protease [Haloarculaceae archaeon H-GB2-1]|nr:rhomboid family intramembrane serine protease [Haloarculaceae archaeon H-GB2-1]